MIPARSVSIYSILLGVLTGLLLAMTPGTTVVVGLFAVTILFIRRRLPRDDRSFVTSILISAFAARIVLAVVLHAHSYLLGFDGFISGDERLYTLKGWDILLQWRGDIYGNFIREYRHGINPFTYLLAAFYSISGFNAVAAKFVNCYIGILTALAIYGLAFRLFGSRAARISLVIAAFWPSMVKWSASALKDPLIILLVVLTIGLFISIVRKERVFLNTFMATAAIFILGLLQRSLLPIMLVCLASAVLLSLMAIRVKGVKEFIATAIVFALLGGIAAAAFSFVFKDRVTVFLKDCEKHQISIAVSDNAGYTTFKPDFSHDLDSGTVRAADIFAAYLKGLAYFLLSPFPWAIKSLSQLAAYPQMIVWYLGLLLFSYGFIKGGGSAAKETLVIGMFIFLFSSVNSFAEGNIGAAFRHRDYISPFVFVYASCGLTALVDKISRSRIKV